MMRTVLETIADDRSSINGAELLQSELIDYYIQYQLEEDILDKLVGNLKGDITKLIIPKLPLPK